jgi:hypothetical protein
MKGYLGALLMGLHKKLFEDCLGSYLSKFDLGEKLPRVLHRAYLSVYKSY